jgi:hypothetical protein
MKEKITQLDKQYEDIIAKARQRIQDTDFVFYCCQFFILLSHGCIKTNESDFKVTCELKSRDACKLPDLYVIVVEEDDKILFSGEYQSVYCKDKPTGKSFVECELNIFHDGSWVDEFVEYVQNKINEEKIKSLEKSIERFSPIH